MSTLGSNVPDSTVPPVRRTSTEGRLGAESLDGDTPDLRGKLRHMVESSKERVTEWKGGLEGGIRARPLQSVLIAAGVGAVLGLIIGRRSR